MSQQLTFTCQLCPYAVCAVADAGADITAVDNEGCNMADHALRATDGSFVGWVLTHKCPLPTRELKTLLHLLQVRDARLELMVQYVNVCIIATFTVHASDLAWNVTQVMTYLNFMKYKVCGREHCKHGHGSWKRDSANHMHTHPVQSRGLSQSRHRSSQRERCRAHDNI
jgi:hypothetical protein